MRIIVVVILIVAKVITHTLNLRGWRLDIDLFVLEESEKLHRCSTHKGHTDSQYQTCIEDSAPP